MQEKLEVKSKPYFKEVASFNLNRLGKIFCRLSIVCSVLTPILFLGVIFAGLLFAVLVIGALFAIIVVIIFTLGTVFIWGQWLIDFLWGFLMNSDEFKINIVADFIFKCVPYFAYASFALALLGVLFVALSKKKSVATIVLTIVFLTVSAFMLVLFYSNGGGLVWEN